MNVDHYPTEVMRKAMIWSTTTGLARSYLEPRYQSDDPSQDFKTAEEIIELLLTYFITGYETEEYRNRFDDMLIAEKRYENETFPAFIARFYSTAVKARKDNKE